MKRAWEELRDLVREQMVFLLLYLALRIMPTEMFRHLGPPLAEGQLSYMRWLDRRVRDPRCEPGRRTDGPDS